MCRNSSKRQFQQVDDLLLASLVLTYVGQLVLVLSQGAHRNIFVLEPLRAPRTIGWTMAIATGLCTVVADGQSFGLLL